ncbi:hypothetical protein J4455_04165 [Candidatus Woesearchaeota archaeon]|nr:hypothetical protein [Candidatus Woesearchaeota archaeon]
MKKRTMLLISLVITTLIFLAGFLLGYSLDKSRISDVVEKLEEDDFQRDSYVTEQKFLNLFHGDVCYLTTQRLNDLSKHLAETGKVLTDYEVRGIFNDNEYLSLKKRYFVSEIKFYILLKELKDNCNYDRYVILFFYDQNNRESIQQGYILDAVVRRLQNITVLSIDRELSNDPSVSALINYYNITFGPTIIVNFEDKYEGLTNVNEVIDIINKK